MENKENYPFGVHISLSECFFSFFEREGKREIEEQAQKCCPNSILDLIVFCLGNLNQVAFMSPPGNSSMVTPDPSTFIVFSLQRLLTSLKTSFSNEDI